MSSRIKQFFKSAEAAVWTAANPLLKEGEPGFESDTNKMKVGDGLNRWNDFELNWNRTDNRPYRGVSFREDNER